MQIAVDADLVTAVGDLLCELGEATDLLADEEEDRLLAGRLEQIENGGRPLGMRTVVEGQRRLGPVEA